MGAWTVVYLGGYALSSLGGGYAMDAIGSRQAFMIVGAAGMAGGLLFYLLHRSHVYRAVSLSRTTRSGPPDSSLEVSLKPPVVGLEGSDRCEHSSTGTAPAGGYHGSSGRHQRASNRHCPEVPCQTVETPTVDLFQPCTLGRLESRNRFVRSATTSGHANEHGIVGPEIIKRYADLAQGGIGLIIKGHLYVDPKGKAHSGMAGISSNKHIPALTMLTAAVHSHSGRILAQINHAGCRAAAGERMGPSSLKTPAWCAGAMDVREISRVVWAFGEAAERCVHSGFDGVQIHAAHGYLVSQFLSKYANRRTDDWGGDLANRMRLLREIYLEMRTRLGDGAVIGVKLNCDDFSRDGFTIDESAQVAEELSHLGVDFIEVSGGGLGMEAQYQARARSRDLTLSEASFGGHCEAIREATRPTPLALVDGLASLAGMQAVVDKGLADLVSLSRPFIREPDLVKRLSAGQQEAKCIRCGGCSDILGEEMTRCVLI